MREECLNLSWFENLFDARRTIAAWRKEYDEERPHSSLGYKTPKEFAARLRPSASTERSERQGIQAPSLAPRAPPSRLKPRMEQQKLVVFLRKLGAGQRDPSAKNERGFHPAIATSSAKPSERTNPKLHLKESRLEEIRNRKQ